MSLIVHKLFCLSYLFRVCVCSIVHIVLCYVLCDGYIIIIISSEIYTRSGW